MNLRVPSATQRLRRIARRLAGTALATLGLSGPAADTAPQPESTPVTALAFTPDGSFLVSNGDRSIVIRSPRDGLPIRSIACPLAKITSIVACGTDSPAVLVGGGEPGVRGALRIVRLDNIAAPAELSLGSDLVTGIALGASRRHLAVSCADHSAWILPWNGGTPSTNHAIRLAGHSGAVLSIAFLDADETVLTAGSDRSLKVWKTATGELLRSLATHTEAIHSIAVRPRSSPSENQPAVCATGGQDRTLRVWQPSIGRMVRIVRGHDGPVFAVAWTRDGNAVLTAGQEGIVRRVDADSDAILDRWHWHRDWIYSIAVHPDGSRVATGDWSGTVQVHRLDEPR